MRGELVDAGKLPASEVARLRELVRAFAEYHTVWALEWIRHSRGTDPVIAHKGVRPSDAVVAAPYCVAIRSLLAAGYSPADLGRRIGYSHTQIHHLAQGERTWIHRDCATAIDKMLQRMSVPSREPSPEEMG